MAKGETAAAVALALATPSAALAPVMSVEEPAHPLLLRKLSEVRLKFRFRRRDSAGPVQPVRVGGLDSHERAVPRKLATHGVRTIHADRILCLQGRNERHAAHRHTGDAEQRGERLTGERGVVEAIGLRRFGRRHECERGALCYSAVLRRQQRAPVARVAAMTRVAATDGRGETHGRGEEPLFLGPSHSRTNSAASRHPPRARDTLALEASRGAAEKQVRATTSAIATARRPRLSSPGRAASAQSRRLVGVHLVLSVLVHRGQVLRLEQHLVRVWARVRVRVRARGKGRGRRRARARTRARGIVCGLYSTDSPSSPSTVTAKRPLSGTKRVVVPCLPA